MLNVISRLDALEQKIKTVEDTNLNAYAYKPSEPIPVLPADATPAQRRLDAELKMMDETIGGGRPPQ